VHSNGYNPVNILDNDGTVIWAATKIQDELETLVNERKTEKFGERDIDLKYLKKLQKL